MENSIGECKTTCYDHRQNQYRFTFNSFSQAGKYWLLLISVWFLFFKSSTGLIWSVNGNCTNYVCNERWNSRDWLETEVRIKRVGGNFSPFAKQTGRSLPGAYRSQCSQHKWMWYRTTQIITHIRPKLLDWPVKPSNPLS